MSDTLGTRLLKLREAKGWTQTELSRRANLSVSAVSQFEAGNRAPSFDALMKLCQALEVSVDLLAGTGDRSDPLRSNPEFAVMFRKFSALPPTRQDQAMRIFNSVVENLEDPKEQQ